CGYNKYLGFYLQQLMMSGQWLLAAGIFARFLQRGTVVSQFSYREAKRYLPWWLRFSEDDVRGAALLAANARIHVGLNGTVTDRQILDLESLSVPALFHYQARLSMQQSAGVPLQCVDCRR